MIVLLYARALQFLVFLVVERVFYLTDFTGDALELFKTHR